MVFHSACSFGHNITAYVEGGQRQAGPGHKRTTKEALIAYWFIYSVRLQTESENTKLLKIQQREREVEAQYLS